QKASQLEKPVIFAIGNAPTALIEIERLVREENYKPLMIIAVPVGFVNVVESKELIIDSNIDSIVSKGRKGGSNIAAAICNALIYIASENERE
ncbi:MAG: precorrin-8X methylmutase, partial [Clostridium sp.]